jgi:H+-transporting ATPase
MQTIKGPDGEVFKVTKGAPHIIAALCKDELTTDRAEAEVLQLGQRGIRTMGVARTKPGSMDEWMMLGMLTFLDPPRPDTKSTIDQVGGRVGGSEGACV